MLLLLLLIKRGTNVDGAKFEVGESADGEIAGTEFSAVFTELITDVGVGSVGMFTHGTAGRGLYRRIPGSLARTNADCDGPLKCRGALQDCCCNE